MCVCVLACVCVCACVRVCECVCVCAGNVLIDVLMKKWFNRNYDNDGEVVSDINYVIT